MHVKVDIAVTHLIGFIKGSRFMVVNALGFEDGEKIFRHGVGIQIPLP